MEEERLDKWLWAARFFKTRSIAQHEIDLGRVLIGGAKAKSSRSVRPGDLLEIHRAEEVLHVYVEGLSNVRGPASAAQALYRETEESRKKREAMKELRKLAAEPSLERRGRPTKKEGRQLRSFKESF